MHFKGHIITKKIPTQEEIEKILEPYYYDQNNVFDWDWYQIGGRFGGKIKINFDPESNEDDWYSFRDRNYKYFICGMLDDLKETVKFYDELNYLKYMGLRENVLYVDGAYYKDMINFEIDDCYVVIDEDKLYVRETWDGDNWVQDVNFDDKVKKIDLTNKFITIIDFHS